MVGLESGSPSLHRLLHTRRGREGEVEAYRKKIGFHRERSLTKRREEEGTFQYNCSQWLCVL